mmetsp:Transcript_13282/g.32481  ORF Transcript_13282/g.32481 Transcript_13282/m.32481 type:complete len:269 (+) Transcript_13282:1243-2049(+)
MCRTRKLPVQGHVQGHRPRHGEGPRLQGATRLERNRDLPLHAPPEKDRQLHSNRGNADGRLLEVFDWSGRGFPDRDQGHQGDGGAFRGPHRHQVRAVAAPRDEVRAGGHQSGLRHGVSIHAGGLLPAPAGQGPGDRREVGVDRVPQPLPGVHGLQPAGGRSEKLHAEGSGETNDRGNEDGRDRRGLRGGGPDGQSFGDHKRENPNAVDLLPQRGMRRSWWSCLALWGEGRGGSEEVVHRWWLEQKTVRRHETNPSVFLILMLLAVVCL